MYSVDVKYALTYSSPQCILVPMMQMTHICVTRSQSAPVSRFDAKTSSQTRPKPPGDAPTEKCRLRPGTRLSKGLPCPWGPTHVARVRSASQPGSRTTLSPPQTEPRAVRFPDANGLAASSPGLGAIFSATPKGGRGTFTPNPIDPQSPISAPSIAEVYTLSVFKVPAHLGLGAAPIPRLATSVGEANVSCGATNPHPASRIPKKHISDTLQHINVTARKSPNG